MGRSGGYPITSLPSLPKLNPRMTRGCLAILSVCKESCPLAPALQKKFFCLFNDPINTYPIKKYLIILL